MEDEKELAQRYGSLDHIDSKSASVMFEVLRKKLNYTESYPHFLSILEHALLLPLHGANFKVCPKGGGGGGGGLLQKCSK